MACIGEITCDSDIGGAPFIIADKGTITSAQSEVKSLAEKIGEIITQVEGEVTNGGLDEYSLYVNGSSPAYDEANKILKDLGLIQEDLSKICESYEQNYLEHYSKELKKFIEVVTKKIEELEAELKSMKTSLAQKEEAYKSTRNDPDRPSYKADIDALREKITNKEEEIKKYKKKLEDAEQVLQGIAAEIEKIVAAKLADEQAKTGNPPGTTGDNDSPGTTSYGPGYVGPGTSRSPSKEEKPKEEEKEEQKIKIEYDLDKDKVTVVQSKAYIKSSKEELSEIDKYIEEIKKKGKVPEDFTGYYYDKANNRILYLTKGKLERVNKPALIDGKFFYFKDGIAHIINNNYTADNMNIPYYNLEKGLLVEGKIYTQEELAKLLKETPSLATSAAGISFLLGKNVDPTELTNIQGWDYKANQDLNGLKLAEQYEVNAFATNNEEYVTTAIKNGYPVSIAKEDGYVTVVGIDEKGNYKVLDPKNEESLTTTVTKEELFKDVKKETDSRYTIYGAKSPEEYDKTKKDVKDIIQKTNDPEAESHPDEENNTNNENQTNNDNQNNDNNQNQDNDNNQNQDNDTTNDQSNNTNNENQTNTESNQSEQNNTNKENENTNTNNQNETDANNQSTTNNNQRYDPRNFWERHFNNQNQGTNTNNANETQNNTNQNSNSQNA